MPGVAKVAPVRSEQWARPELRRQARTARARRRNIVTMTKRGEHVLERVDGVLDEVQDAVLVPLTPNERKVLVCLLAKLTR